MPAFKRFRDCKTDEDFILYGPNAFGMEMGDYFAVFDEPTRSGGHFVDRAAKKLAKFLTDRAQFHKYLYAKDVLQIEEPKEKKTKRAKKEKKTVV